MLGISLPPFGSRVTITSSAPDTPLTVAMARPLRSTMNVVEGSIEHLETALAVARREGFDTARLRSAPPRGV